MQAAKRLIINLLLTSAVSWVFLVLTSSAYYLLSGDDVVAKAMFHGTAIGMFYSPVPVAAALILEFGGSRLSSSDVLRLLVVTTCAMAATLSAVIGLVAAGTAWGFVLIPPAAILGCVVRLPPVHSPKERRMDPARALVG